MPTKTITLTKTNSGGETDNYNIYHTSVSAPNLVASGVSRATLEGGVQYTVDVSYYTFIIVSTGTCTNQTTVNITPSDVTAPSIPTGLTASNITQTTFTLNWNDSTETESGLAGYKIFVNGVHTYSVTNGDSIAGLAGQPAGATITYTISAYDNAGNESSQSSGINVTFIPATPTGLFELSDTTTSITASWSSVTGATGYRLRRGASTVIYTGASTSASDTGMTCGTGSNIYYVEAYNATGSSGYSGGVTMTVSPDVTAPTVPTGLYKVSQTETTLSVAWNASTDSCSGMGSYYISVDGGAQIYTGTDLSHTLTGLTANTSYGVQVKARDNAGNYSNYSSSVNMSTDNVAVPSVPTGLYEISDTTTSVTMGWNTSTGSVTGYRLRRGASTTVYTGAVTSYTDSGLACGTASNTYYVQAYGPGGDSAWSSGVTGNVAADVTAPSIPSNVHHIGTTTSSATITCDVSTDACTGVAGYYLYKDNVQYGSLGTTTRSVTGLSAGTSYLFKMSAQDNASNISSASSNITVWTQCIAPTLSYSSHTTTSVTVARNSVTGATSYSLYWRVSGGSYALATSAMGTSYTKTGLTQNVSYDFYVVAVGNAGSSASSNVVTQTTTLVDNTAPSVPGNFRKTNQSGDVNTLTWSASSDNIAVTGYQLMICLTPANPAVDGNYSVSSDLGNVLTTTADSTEYGDSFKIRAYDAAGNFSGLTSNYINNATAIYDVTAPTVPTNLSSSSITDTAFTLSWTGSTDYVGVVGYKIYKNGSLYSTEVGAGTSLGITGQTAGASSTWKVSAYDAASNESAQSSGLVVQQTNSGGNNRTIQMYANWGTLTQIYDACYYGDSLTTWYFVSSSTTPQVGDYFYTTNSYSTVKKPSSSTYLYCGTATTIYKCNFTTGIIESIQGNTC